MSGKFRLNGPSTIICVRRFDSAMTEDTGHPVKSAAYWRPFRFLSRIAGALSIVNLIRDLHWFTLKGILATWVAAYDHLILGVTHTLFGWISVPWMQVSRPESHLIVVAALIYTSRIRADKALSFESFFGNLAISLFMSAVVVGLAGLVALLLPGWWGIGAMILFVICYVVYLFSFEESYSVKDGLVNLVSVLGFALIVILAGSLIR